MASAELEADLVQIKAELARVRSIIHHSTTAVAVRGGRAGWEGRRALEVPSRFPVPRQELHDQVLERNAELTQARIRARTLIEAVRARFAPSSSPRPTADSLRSHVSFPAQTQLLLPYLFRALPGDVTVPPYSRAGEAGSPSSSSSALAEDCARSTTATSPAPCPAPSSSPRPPPPDVCLGERARPAVSRPEFRWPPS